MGHLCERWEDVGCPSLNTCRTCQAHEEDTADDRQEDYHTSWHPYACPQSCMYTRANYNTSRRLPPFSFMEARGGRTEWHFYKFETVNLKTYRHGQAEDCTWVVQRVDRLITADVIDFDMPVTQGEIT